MADDKKNSQNNNDLSKPTSEPASGQPAATSAKPIQKFSIPTPSEEKPAQPVVTDTLQSATPAAPTPTPTQTIRSSGQNPNLEGGIISAKLPLVVVSPHNESLKKLVEHYRDDEDVKIYENAVNMVPMLARQLKPCIILASITGSTDVVKYLTMLKPLKEDLKQNRIKFILISKINNPGIIATFEKAGCHEYIVEPIAERSMFFKVNLQTKAIKGQRKKMRAEEQKKLEEGRNPKKGDAGAVANDSAGASETDKNVQSENAKETEDDKWVFRGNKPKKKGGKWTMRMKGPDPSEGDWQPAGKAADGSTQWRFMDKDGNPKDANDPKKKKGWEFTGDKPSFNNGEWQFEGEKPELSLVDENGEKISSKVRSDGKEGLITAKDTGTALAKVQEREEKQAAEKEKKKKSLFSTGARDEGGGAGLGLGQGGEKTDAGGQINDKTGGGAPAGGANELNLAGQGKGEGASGTSLGGKDQKTELAQKKTSLKGKSLDGKDSGDTDTEDDEENVDGLGSSAKNFLKKKKEGADSAVAGEEQDSQSKNSSLASKNGNRSQTNALNDKTGGSDATKSGGRGLGQGTGPDGKGGQTSQSSKEAANADAKSASASARAKDKRSLSPFDDAASSEKKRELSDLEENDGKTTFDKDGKPIVGGKNNAKTEKIRNSDWQGHDLTPDELLKREEREKRQKKLKESLASRGKKDETADDGASHAAAAAENAALGKKKNAANAANAAADKGAKKDGEASSGSGDEAAPAGFNDKSGTKDDVQGGWSKHREEEEKKKRKINARDSDQEAKTDDRDQMVEIDQPKGTLTHNMMGDKVWEYPPDFFGTVNGTWESAGNDSQDEKKRKCFVFVEPEIRMKKVDDVRTMATWWVFHGERPLFNVHKKVWFCKINEPKKVNGFAKLPQVVQNFLLSVSTATNDDKKKSAEDKKKKTKDDHAEQLKKAKDDFKEQQSSVAEKKKKIEEEKKSAMDELRKLNSKEENSNKQSNNYGEEAAKKKDKNGVDGNADKTAQAKDASQAGKDEKDADANATKDEKERKKKERLKAELDLTSAEKTKKDKEEKEQDEQDEKLGSVESLKKKKERLEANLDLERTKKEGDKGKQNLDSKESKKNDDQSKQTLDKKAEDAAGGTQKLDKKEADDDFTHEKEGKEEKNESASEKREKQLAAKKKLEADLKFDEKEAASAKDKESGDEGTAAEKLEKKKKELNDLNSLDLGLKSEEKSGGKSSHSGAEGTGDESSSSKVEKDAAQAQGAGFTGDVAKDGAEEGALSPLDEALKEKTIVPLPSAPMMAVFFSENLISNRGDVQKTFDRFVKFLSQGCGGVAVTLFYVSKGGSGDFVLRVGASSHPHHVVATELGLADVAGVAEAIRTRGAHYPNPDGPLFLAVNASKAADRDPIGILMFEPLDSGMRFTKLVKYFQGIAQCLRGAVLKALSAPRSGMADDSVVHKEAA